MDGCIEGCMQGWSCMVDGTSVETEGMVDCMVGVAHGGCVAPRLTFGSSTGRRGSNQEAVLPPD